MNSFYSDVELKELGLKSIGENVLISRKCSIYDATEISIGNNVRIDDFSILSGRIEIGNYVHIAAGCYLFAGNAGIKLDDFSGISSRSAIYAVSDDYSGNFMTNPVIPDEYRQVNAKSVNIQKHGLVGSGSTILPGADIAEGTAIGAMSLVTKKTQAWKIYSGVPARIIAEREKNLLNLEKKFVEELHNKIGAGEIS